MRSFWLRPGGDASAEPNRSPLDFMLALMRDSQVPMDLRIEVAAQAAPFVHARPMPGRKKQPAPDLPDPAGDCGDLNFGRLEVTSASNGSDGLSPLDFLLAVMADPDATPRQRVKAAALA